MYDAPSQRLKTNSETFSPAWPVTPASIDESALPPSRLSDLTHTHVCVASNGVVYLRLFLPCELHFNISLIDTSISVPVCKQKSSNHSREVGKEVFRFHCGDALHNLTAGRRANSAYPWASRKNRVRKPYFLGNLPSKGEAAPTTYRTTAQRSTAQHSHAAREVGVFLP